MNRLRSFILVYSLFFFSCNASRQPAPPVFHPNKAVAHRGAFKKNGYPENSIASLKEAIRIGCTGSEFDVRMTADDSLVINHDPHYNKLEIEKTAFATLRRFPLANGEPIPTLRNYLKAGLENNKHTRLVIEIKPSDISTDRGKLIASRVWKLVNEMNAAPYVVYISFDYAILREIRRLDPQASLQFLDGTVAPVKLKEDSINGADYHFSVFKRNPGWIKEAKENSIQINAWTVNDKETMEWLLKEEVDFITTNEPELLLQLKFRAP